MSKTQNFLQVNIIYISVTRKLLLKFLGLNFKLLGFKSYLHRHKVSSKFEIYFIVRLKKNRIIIPEIFKIIRVGIKRV